MAEQVSSDPAESHVGATPAPASSQVQRSRREVAVATKGRGMGTSAVASLAQNPMLLGAATPSGPAHLQAPTERPTISAEEKRKRPGQWPPSDVPLSEMKRSRVDQGEGTQPASSPSKLFEAPYSSNFCQWEFTKQSRDQKNDASAAALPSSFVFAEISRRQSENDGAASSPSTTTPCTAPAADLEASGTTFIGISAEPPPSICVRQTEECARVENTTAQLRFEGFSPAVDSYAGGDATRSAEDDRLLSSWKSSSAGRFHTPYPLAAQISMPHWRTDRDTQRHTPTEEYGHPEYNEHNEMLAVGSHPAATNALCCRCAAMLPARKFAPHNIVKPDEAGGEEDLVITFRGLQVEDVRKQSRSAAQLKNHTEIPVHSSSSRTCFQCGGLIVKQPEGMESLQEPAKEESDAIERGKESLESSAFSSTKKRKRSEMEGQQEGEPRGGAFRVTSGTRDSHKTEHWPAEASLGGTRGNTLPRYVSQECREAAAKPQAAVITSCASGSPSNIYASTIRRGFSDEAHLSTDLFTCDSGSAYESCQLTTRMHFEKETTKNDSYTAMGMESPHLGRITSECYSGGKQDGPDASFHVAAAPQQDSSEALLSKEMHGQRDHSQPPSVSCDAPSLPTTHVGVWPSLNLSHRPLPATQAASRVSTSTRPFLGGPVGHSSFTRESVDPCTPLEQESASSEEFMRCLEPYIEEQERNPALWEQRAHQEVDLDEEEPQQLHLGLERRVSR